MKFILVAGVQSNIFATSDINILHASYFTDEMLNVQKSGLLLLNYPTGRLCISVIETWVLHLTGNTDEMQRRKNKTDERTTQRYKGVYMFLCYAVELRVSETPALGQG